jgi:hypothetical protein
MRYWGVPPRVGDTMALPEFGGNLNPLKVYDVVWEGSDDPSISVYLLAIPAPMQKNDTEESIPLLPWLEALLFETPKPQRFGWYFNPMSLQVTLKRRVRHQRPSAEWVSKIISRIGAKAGVVVQPAKRDAKAKLLPPMIYAVTAVNAWRKRVCQNVRLRKSCATLT